MAVNGAQIVKDAERYLGVPYLLSDRTEARTRKSGWIAAAWSRESALI
jgi:hypothetical protein